MNKQSGDKSAEARVSEYWDDRGLLLSNDLMAHELFLTEFEPTGDFDLDFKTFLIGTSGPAVVERCAAVGKNLRDLAVEIRQNHRHELARIAEGEPPRWPGKHQRWSCAATSLKRRGCDPNCL